MAALTEFLLARIAEDEAGLSSVLGMLGVKTELSSRRSRECEAGRELVSAYEDLEPTCDHGPWVRLGGVCQCGVVHYTLRAFAAIYSDHPDYDEAWRP